MSNNNYCIILAGGKGVNFWPYSRESYPKQFLDFFGTGESLLQQTYNNIGQIIPEDQIFVVTNKRYEYLVKDQIPQIHPDNLLLEPLDRNTLPSAAWGCYHIYTVNPDANILILSCDQIILKEERFKEAVLQSLDFTEKNKWIVAFALKPTRPETECGYIQISDERVNDHFFKAKSYTKNPERDFAKMFLQSDEFYWYTSMLAGNCRTWMKSLAHFIPDVLDKLEKQPVLTKEKMVEVFYSYSPNLSIDRALLENPQNICVMPGNFGWARVSSWQSVYEIAPKDRDENVTQRTRTLMYNSHQNVVLLPKGKLAVIQDLNGYLIAEKDNVLVICKKNDDRCIRKFVNDAQVKLGNEYL